MNFTVLLLPAALREYNALPQAIRIRITRALEDLADNPRPTGAVKLKGTDNLWRIRVGSYRVVYEIQDDRLIVLVLRVAHRKDVYRGM